MRIDPTTTTSGGSIITTELETIDLVLQLDPAPLVLEATVVPTTVSIVHMFLDSFDPGTPTDPDPEPDLTKFFGVPSMTLGFGGAPPYITAYPLGGI
jgi:hypothetical protein